MFYENKTQKGKAMRNVIVNKIVFLVTSLVALISLNACSHTLESMTSRSYNETVINGNETKSAIFDFERVEDFVVADDNSKQETVLHYKISKTIYNEDGLELNGKITDYCQLEKVNKNGKFIKTQEISGSTYKSDEGYLRISNCKMSIQVAAEAHFNLESGDNVVVSKYATVLASQSNGIGV